PQTSVSHCLPTHRPLCSPFFSSTTPAPPDIYTLSLHDALPICRPRCARPPRRDERVRIHDARLRERCEPRGLRRRPETTRLTSLDRKSTRLNSSHVSISYAVFCLKKKKTKTTTMRDTAR